MTDPTAITPERIMDLVSVLEDRVAEWARGATPESRSIRADKVHAAQTAVHSAIRTALARPAALVVPEGSVVVLREAVARIHAVLDRLTYTPEVDFYDLEDILNDIFPPRPILTAARSTQAIRTALARPAALVVPEDVLDIHRHWTDTTWAVRVRWSRTTGSVLGKGNTVDQALIEARRLAAIYDDAPDPSDADAEAAPIPPVAVVVPEDVVVTERRDDGRFNVCRDDGEEYLWAVGATLHEAYQNAYMGQPWDEFNEQARSKRYRGGS